jgi:hypothetical protein
VVELKDDRIALAAINARVGCQVLLHAKLVLFRADGSHLLSEMIVPFRKYQSRLYSTKPGLHHD